jgi:BirA family biotin operon repressor/biotin-[acetyl-CoA-carboxylase] ligase
VMLALGLATQQAIAQVTALAPDLRWPNDVLLRIDGEDRKCAGILAQLEVDAIVAGIGINVNHSAFPNDLDALATSLVLAGKRGIAMDDLLAALIREVDEYCEILSKQGTAPILELFAQASSYAQGRRVRIENDGAMIEGVTCGLSSSGFLRVREDNGKETTILAGGVRPA